MKLPFYHSHQSGRNRPRGTPVFLCGLNPADRWLAGSVLLLSLFGVVMVYESSVAIAVRDFSDQFYFIREQLKWLALGLTGLFIGSKLSYRIWHMLAVPFFFATIALLLMVFLPGLGIRAQGAHRWLNFGFFVFQPAEFAKFTTVLYLSAWLRNSESNRFSAFVIYLCMTVGLILLEPDMGTSFVLLLIAISMYFFSGEPIRHLFIFIPIMAIVIIGLAIISPYRLSRVMTFLNLQEDPLGASYQIRQVLVALGSGGWTGVGIGKSRQKYEYLPEANTDSIFAIIAEELGFVGSVCVILVYMVIIWRCFKISIRAPDNFGRLFALGAGIWIACQTIVNLSAMVALIPLTGIPLPFVSYGGSSLIIALTAVGIVLNISTYKS